MQNEPLGASKQGRICAVGEKELLGFPTGLVRDCHASRVMVTRESRYLRTRALFEPAAIFQVFPPLSSPKSLGFLHFWVFWVHGLLKWRSRLLGGASFSWLPRRAVEALVDSSWRGWPCQHHGWFRQVPFPHAVVGGSRLAWDSLFLLGSDPLLLFHWEDGSCYYLGGVCRASSVR